MRTFNGKKYLSIARDNFTVIKIDDIGEVKEDPVTFRCNAE